MPDLENAKTGIQPTGHGGRPHGDFSGKTPATTYDVVKLTEISCLAPTIANLSGLSSTIDSVDGAQQ